MTDRVMQHFRIPADVLAAARARAKREHRTLTDVVVQALLAYGQGGTEAGAAPVLAAMEAQPAPRSRRVSREHSGPALGALIERTTKRETCPHPPARVHKGLCGACGSHVG